MFAISVDHLGTEALVALPRTVLGSIRCCPDGLASRRASSSQWLVSILVNPHRWQMLQQGFPSQDALGCQISSFMLVKRCSVG